MGTTQTTFPPHSVVDPSAYKIFFYARADFKLLLFLSSQAPSVEVEAPSITIVTEATPAEVSAEAEIAADVPTPAAVVEVVTETTAVESSEVRIHIENC